MAEKDKGETGWESPSSGLTLFVSPDGSDSAPGSEAKPFASIERARDYLREMREKDGAALRLGARVKIREGTYLLEQNLIFSKQDSGTENAPIIYQSFPNERVSITGGPQFRLADFQPVSDPNVRERIPQAAVDRVRMLDLKARGVEDFGSLPLYGHSMAFLEKMTEFKKGAIAPELFFEESPLTLARWPNDDFAQVGQVVERGDAIRAWMPDARGGMAMTQQYVPEEERNDPPKGFAFRFDRDRLSLWESANDLRLYGYWYHNWSDQSVEVDSIDAEAGIIRSLQPSGYTVKAGQRFYAYNLLEELDEPGEWYLDRETGILYLYPPEDNPEARIVLALTTGSLVGLDSVESFIFDGIEFGYTRGKAIQIKGGRNIVIRNSRITNVGDCAIQIRGGRNHLIDNNEVFNTGGSGITVEGGDLVNLISSDHLISNNHIYNFARIEKTYNPAIRLNGVGHVARNNEINRTAHMAINFSGNNHLIELNHIYDVARETDDMAAIYSGRSWTDRGTIIRHNLIRDVTGFQSGTHRVSGVYMDDGISGITIEGNIFLNNAQGLMMNGGRDNASINNLFIDVENMARSTNMRQAFTTWAAMSWRTLNENFKKAPVQQPVWRERYTNLESLLDDEPDLPKYNTIRNNLRYNSPIIFGDRGIQEAVVEFGDVGNNSEIDKRPGHFDRETMRFVLDPDSGVFEKMPNLSSIPVDRIGRLKR